MKYKLIKCYPGSPDLGYEISSENKTIDWKGSLFYDKYPEYWEKVNENLWWCVSEKDYKVNYSLFEAWFVYTIESYGPSSLSPLKYFKTKEEAENFVFCNKPCLSYNDLASYFALNPIPNGINGFTLFPIGLKDIIKSKI